MARASETSYKIVDARSFPEELPQGQQDEVDELVKYSLRLDFPERSHREINEFCVRAREARYQGLNAAVGGPLLRRDQSFRNIQYALATRGDEVVAYLPAADNASSKHTYDKEGLKGAVKGVLERQAKLRLTEHGGKDWIAHRYLWLGHAAINKEVREQIQEAPNEVNELDVLMALVLQRHDARQPLSVYPWSEEDDWKTQLDSWKLHADPSYSEDIDAFGESADTVTQEHWIGTNAGKLTQTMYLKEDPRYLLSHGMVDGDT